MFGNRFGERLRLTTFGESHGPAIGGIIEGLPAGLELDVHFLQGELDRRKPGRGQIATSSRQESDRLHILSGLFEGKTLGTPLAFMIYNEDAQSGDYVALRDLYRPGHADYTYAQKYGHYDPRSGGRSSARETASRVVGGAVAKSLLSAKGIHIHAEIFCMGGAYLDTEQKKAVEKAQKEGDSLGGIIRCTISGCPAGVGEPVFAKLQAKLAEAMLSIPAAKGFEYGEGFGSAFLRGSKHNDVFAVDNEKSSTGNLHLKTTTNRCGGLLGGISTGDDIRFAVAFKPISSISKTQKTAKKDGTSVDFQTPGRHDTSCLPRAIPVVEAMAALVMADFLID